MITLLFNILNIENMFMNIPEWLVAGGRIGNPTLNTNY